MRQSITALAALLAALPLAGADEPTEPFAENGPPKGWVVRAWNDVARPAGPNTEWTVTEVA